MNRPARTRLSLESLEDRSCPSVSAGLVDGSLVVTANQATSLQIAQLDTDSFLVREFISGKEFAIDNVTEDVIVRLSRKDDTVQLFLDSTPGNVYVDLGNGNNTLVLWTGNIQGNLGVRSGSGEDVLRLGDSSSFNLSVAGATLIATGKGNDRVILGDSSLSIFTEMSGPVFISLGDGDDRLENYTILHQPSYIHLGDGNDLFLNAVFLAEGSHVYGGCGTDTYNGDRFNVLTDSFELYDQW